MYQNIMVAVALDHPEHVARALEVARALLAQGGRITALHVIEDLPDFVANEVPAQLLRDRKPNAEADLKAMLEGAPDVTQVVIFGHAGRTLVDYADDSGTDCIVIASHKPGLQDFFIGSTAQRVVRHATCAVHVLR